MSGDLTAVYYQHNKILIQGNTKKWKENLKELGCRYVAHLPEYNNTAGWTCMKDRQEVVMQFIANANAGLVQPKAWSPREQTAPGATAGAPMVGRDATPVAMNPADALALLRQTQAAQPAVATPAPPQQQTVAFPNLFIGADGLAYQVIVYVAPVPVAGKGVTVRAGEEINDYVIVSTAQSTPYDTAVISHEEETLNLALVAGHWQVVGRTDIHTVTFHQ